MKDIYKFYQLYYTNICNKYIINITEKYIQKVGEKNGYAQN